MSLRRHLLEQAKKGQAEQLRLTHQLIPVLWGRERPRVVSRHLKNQPNPPFHDPTTPMCPITRSQISSSQANFLCHPVSFATDTTQHRFSQDSDPESIHFEFCGACKTRHIRPGPLSSLKYRDTCCSMLPDWFPKQRYPQHEWATFLGKWNRYWDVSAVLKGEFWEDDSRIKKASSWEAEYHEPSIAWMEAGRKGGWWKCRINSEDPMVSEVERNCQACKDNATYIEAARARGKEVGWKMMDSRAQGQEIGNKKSLADMVARYEYEVLTPTQLLRERWEHEKFVRLCMVRTMKEDRDVVLERVRKSGC